MARIPTYEIDSVIHDLDMLLGTDYNDNEFTKNFTLSGIAEYVIDKLIDPDAVQSCVPVFRNISDTQGGNATRITSSIINQNVYPSGSNISISGTLDAIETVTVKGASGKSGALVLNCEQNSHGITIQGPPHSAAATYKMILPNDMGTAGQQLATNGTDTLYWDSPSIGGSGTVNTIAMFTPDGTTIGDSPITNPSFSNIELGGSLTIGQYSYLYWGTNSSDRLSISNGLSGSDIRQIGPGNLLIQCESNIELKAAATGGGSEALAKFKEDGPIELYYDNVKTFETTSTGITVTGTQSSFTGQVTIPTTPVANTDAASKAYVDSQAGGLDLIQTEVTITSAQMLSLNGGATIQLIAAPGANKIIAILNALIHLDYGTVTYDFATAGLSDGVGLSYGTQQIQGDNAFFTNNLNSTSDTYFIGDPLGVSAGTNMTPNQPLNLISTSGVSVSQGNSPIKMSILYREISIPFTQA